MPIPWTETLAKYLFVRLVLINASYTSGKRGHMCIGYFREHMPLKAQIALDQLDIEKSIMGQKQHW